MKITEMYRQRLRQPYKNRYAWGAKHTTYDIYFYNVWEREAKRGTDGRLHVILNRAGDLSHSGQDLSTHPELIKRKAQLNSIKEHNHLGYCVMCYAKDWNDSTWEIKDVDGDYLYKIVQVYTDVNGNTMAVIEKEVLNWCKAS